jgi:phosphoribosylglycinamide formyltransferase-1
MGTALITNASGGQLEVLLSSPHVRKLVRLIVTDSINANVNIADKWGIPHLVVDQNTNQEFNEALPELLSKHSIAHLLSFGFTRIFTAHFLTKFTGTVFNSHFSLLPAFPGRKNADWTTEILPPRAIFERALLYGVRFIGNTIHTVDESIDGGYPVIQSCLEVPYDTEPKTLRHQLFLQECRCISQILKWISDGRISGTGRSTRVIGARFGDAKFSPALEEEWIIKFNTTSLGSPSRERVVVD